MKSDYKGNGNDHGPETVGRSQPRDVDVGHEIDHVHIRGIVTFLVALTIMTIGSYLLMWGMFRILNSQEQARESRRSPMAMTSNERLPPEPRLQSAPGFGQGLQKEAAAKQAEMSAESREPKDPLWEINVLREHWDVILKDGVKDQSGRVLILPIEDAKKALLQQGLPVLADSKADVTVEMPTAASSGRTTEKRKQ